jgi:8-oxo-dGTP pyrophosphatase MutT (NUDIX family)
MNRTDWGPEASGPEVALQSRRVAFENSRFTVFSDHIVSQGLEVKDFLVVAPHTRRPDLLSGVVIVPVLDDSILLLNVYRHSIGRHVWELPRGFLEPDEAPSAAALRELEEETGLVCALEKLIDLGYFYPEPGILRAQVGLFAATECRAEGAILQDEIGIGARAWFPQARVREMLRDGGITEGSSSVALYRYFAR